MPFDDMPFDVMRMRMRMRIIIFHLAAFYKQCGAGQDWIEYQIELNWISNIISACIVP